MITLARILLYPIKSLPSVIVDEAVVLASGALQHDRRYALFDAEGMIVNAKRIAKLQRVRCELDLNSGNVSLGTSDSLAVETFQIDNDLAGINAWFSHYLDMSVQIRENGEQGFPDDLDSLGPTVISTGSLLEVSRWFSGVDCHECRERFRANLELEGAEPFWEDCLFGEIGSSVAFSIGEVRFEGINPCQRCAVPTRSPGTGEPIRGFQKVFSEKRKTTLSEDVPRSRFDHYYRLAVNTRVPPSECGKTLRVGDPVQVGWL